MLQHLCVCVCKKRRYIYICLKISLSKNIMWSCDNVESQSCLYGETWQCILTLIELIHISRNMLLKGLWSLLVCLKKCQVSSAKVPSVPYEKVTLSNFIRTYTVSLGKMSNSICQKRYQKIHLCSTCSYTWGYYIHVPIEEYLPLEYSTWKPTVKS